MFGVGNQHPLSVVLGSLVVKKHFHSLLMDSRRRCNLYVNDLFIQIIVRVYDIILERKVTAAAGAL